MADQKRPSISFEELLPKTRDGIARFCMDNQAVFNEEEQADGPTLEMWAELWFRLRAAEDRPEWFPSGKWATIQYLETLIDSRVAEPVK